MLARPHHSRLTAWCPRLECDDEAMTFLQMPGSPEPLRLEIANPGRDLDGRLVFHLLFHDDGQSVVWDGTSYEDAILAAEAWDHEDIEVIDTVTDKPNRRSS